MISVIIPARNEGLGLWFTIDYLFRQKSFRDLEVIVVDDASDVPVKDFGDGVKLIRNEQREGIARSRNIGARAATGDVLLFTDAHVSFSDNWYEAVLNCPKRTILGATTELIYSLDSVMRIYGWKFNQHPEDGVEPIRESQSSSVHAVPYVGATWLAMRSGSFADIGGFDDGLTQCGSIGDAEIAMRCHSWGWDVLLDPNVVCFHRCFPQKQYDMDGMSPLDLPRYEGSMLNAFRIMWLHFPFSSLAKTLAAIQDKYPKTNKLIESFTVSPEMRYRKESLDMTRVKKEEYVFEKITGIL